MDKIINPELSFGVYTGFVVGIIISAILPNLNLPKSLYELAKGIPKWNYLASMFLQLAVYPPLLYLSWSSAGFSWHWIESGWYDVDRYYDRMIFYVMTMQLSKDLYLIRAIPMLLIHHLLCQFGLFFFYELPFGIGGIVLSIVTLEFGSLFYNLELLYPGDKFLKWYVFGITFSGISVGAGMIWWVYRACYRDDIWWGSILFLFVSGFSLVIIRQLVCRKHCAHYCKDHEKKEHNNKENNNKNNKKHQ